MSHDGMRIGSAGTPLPVNPSGARKDAQTAGAVQKTEAAMLASATQQQAAQTPQKLEAVAQRLETYLRSVSRSLEFRVDSASGKTVVTVRDSETGDLIRQIPGDEVLRLAEMAEDQTIVLVNESA